MAKNNLWATPNTLDSLPPKSPEALKREMEIARPGRSKPANLRDQVSNMRNWPTPRATLSKSYRLKDRGMNHSTANLEEMLCRASPELTGGQLNPVWVEWLMGWPENWTSLDPLKELKWSDDMWQNDPSENGHINRVETGVKNRVGRLKALGNGQVPQCVKAVWEILSR